MTNSNSIVGIEIAERQLDRIQAFFPRVDSKNSALLAIASAQFAVLALNVTLADLAVWYLAIPILLFAIGILFTGFHLFRCSFPSLDGGASSLVYFREIAKRTEAGFVREYLAVNEASLLEDLAVQIWRNSEIVAKKFDSIKLATIGTMVSLPVWLFALGEIAVVHGHVTH